MCRTSQPAAGRRQFRGPPGAPDATLLEPGTQIPLRDEPCIVALDGEREIELFRPGHGLAITFNPHGPRIINIPAAIRAGALAGVFND